MRADAARNYKRLVAAAVEAFEELEPVTTAHSDDAWRDLADALETVTAVLARRQAIHSLALEFQAFANESAQRFMRPMERGPAPGRAPPRADHAAPTLGVRASRLSRIACPCLREVTEAS